MDIIELAKECAGDDAYDIYVYHPFSLSELQQFAQAIQPKWQPIESAPKDGTRIIVGYGKQSGFPVQIVFYNKTYNFWSHYGDAVFGLENNATHWMPIPKPPQVT